MKILGVGFLAGKFNSDLLWNLLSYAFIGMAGVLINFLIVSFLQYEDLGIFNQVFSIYIILSQLAAFGIHLSLQRFIPEYTEKRELNLILSASIILSTCISVALLLLFGIIINWLGFFPYSEPVHIGTNIMLPGVFFFTMNKLLLSFLIGKREMKKYAILNTLRYFLMLLSLLFLIFLNQNICWLFLGSEFILFIVILFVLFKSFQFRISGNTRYWIKNHFDFGKKAFVGNFVFDVNTKVDILIIGIFANNSLVGLYSFASTFFEGFSQLPVLIRNNINPILTKVYFKGNLELFGRIVKKTIVKSYKFIGLFGLLGIICYPLVLYVSGATRDLLLNWQIFFVLVLGLMVSSGYQVVILMFNQIHQPGKQSILLVLYFASNIILNLLFVPVFGIIGSAIATSLAALGAVFLVKFFASKFISIRI